MRNRQSSFSNLEIHKRLIIKSHFSRFRLCKPNKSTKEVLPDPEGPIIPPIHLMNFNINTTKYIIFRFWIFIIYIFSLIDSNEIILVSLSLFSNMSICIYHLIFQQFHEVINSIFCTRWELQMKEHLHLAIIVAVAKQTYPRY